MGHYARNCPTASSHPSSSRMTPPATIEKQPEGSRMQGSNNVNRGGRGSGGRGQGQVGGVQARVFALTRQDAQASKMFSRCMCFV